MDAFAVKNLSFTYPQQEKPALSGLSFTVPEGQFAVLCGPSGCGKTTLLRQLKPALAPHGRGEGRILYQGEDVYALSPYKQAQSIGFVQQDPDNQLVTDKVWHELAFGLESLGYQTPAIRARVAEMASFFGISDWFYRDVSTLSGGQKQLLNLASVMAMQPGVLLLDEPTSQLDPIAAEEFLSVLVKINRELGVTVILCEHRLEAALPLCDRALVLDEGRLIADGSPAQVGEELRRLGHGMFAAMPTPMRIWSAVANPLPCPVTVRQGRDWLSELARQRVLAAPAEEEETAPKGATVLSAKQLWFRYERDGADVVRGLELALRRGQILALLGGNGAGKSTLLSLLADLHRPYRGRVERTGRLALLPQDPQTLFLKNDLASDLAETFRGTDILKSEQEKRLRQVVRLCRLGALLERHPFDLSGGEQQRAALAKVLLMQPEILLLDEPTKGLDGEFKQVLGAILRRLADDGTAILLVSHDVEFCAEYAHSCALLFNGEIVSQGRPRQFFSGNSFYTTAADRMSRHLLPACVTPSQVILACGGVPPAPPELPGDNGNNDNEDNDDNDDGPQPPPGGGKEDSRPLNEDRVKPDQGQPGADSRPLPRYRRLLALISALGLILAMVYAFRQPLADGWQGLANYAPALGCLLLLALAVTRKATPGMRSRRQLPRRTKLALALILLTIPLTIGCGVIFFGNRKYLVISMLILLEAMLPFALVFEGRKPEPRELVVIAVLCGLCVVSRAAFFMLPQFKPVLALVIITGTALGGETGFLVGALGMLASNMMFSQGPWTPWQMFAAGLVGLLAGVLFHGGRLGTSRLGLSVFGALATLLIYGGLLNPASVIMWQSYITWPMLVSSYALGLPMDLVHAVSTFAFLWLLAEPMLEKLERIKVKYGLVE